MLDTRKDIADVRVGNATVFGGLAVFPLFGQSPGRREYLTLRDAFARDGVEITEISEGGSVPELLLRNRLDRDIFAADGESLIGAKQNRVLNTSIYVRAGTKVSIPVSCVEQGRWSYTHRTFRAGAHSEFLSSRSAKMRSVGATLKRTGTDRRSDQGEVWDRVASRRMAFDACAPTGSMDDVYAAERSSLDSYLEHIKRERGQTGLACAIDGQIVAMELFGDETVFDQFFDRLIRSCAAEVVNVERKAALVPDRADVRAALKDVGEAEAERFDAVGSGEEWRFTAGQLSGASLVVDGRMLHLVALRDRWAGRRATRG